MSAIKAGLVVKRIHLVPSLVATTHILNHTQGLLLPTKTISKTLLRPRSKSRLSLLYFNFTKVRNLVTFKSFEKMDSMEGAGEGGGESASGTSLQEQVGEDPTTKVSLAETGQTSQPKNKKEEGTLSKRAQKRLSRAQRFKEMQKKKRAESLRLAQNEDAGYKNEDFDQSSYVCENGLRKVRPYNYVFSTHAKGRWVGRSIYEVLAKEFGYDYPEELMNGFKQGKILVNNARASSDYVIKDCDFISHRIHRHENPVTDTPIEVLHDTADVLVVNKPSSIPCHPCGRYRFNSLVFILGKEMGYTNLRNIYRLDRLTSGVLILGKTAQHTKLLEDQVAKRQVQKEYVCRVVGRFPDGRVEVDQPLRALSNKLRLQVVCGSGKASKTSFERISYNGTSSVVKCWPVTGRTHQIRVHLQYLGYPILNDGFYNNPAWGPAMAKGGHYEVPHDLVCERILKEHHVNLWDGGENPLYFEKLEAERAKGADIAVSSELTATDTKDVLSNTGTEKQGTADLSASSSIDPSLTETKGVSSNVSSTAETEKEGNAGISSCREQIVSETNNVESEVPSTSEKECSSVAANPTSEGNLNAKEGQSGEEKVLCDPPLNGGNVDGEPPSKRQKVETEASSVSVNGQDASSELVKSFGNNSSSVINNLSSNSSISTTQNVPVYDSDSASQNAKGEMCEDGKKVSVGQRSEPDKLKLDDIDLGCELCKRQSLDPKPKHMVMFLHAVKYKGLGWEYEASLPDWAHQDWDKEQDFLL